MEKKSLGLWVPVLVIVAAVLVLAASADAVEAAKGGKGYGKGGKGGGGGDTAPSVTLTISPNPPPPAYSGETYIIAGTGFTPGAGINFVMGSVAIWTVADSNGYAASPWTAWAPGTYTVYAKELTSKGFVTVGSITYTIR